MSVRAQYLSAADGRSAAAATNVPPPGRTGLQARRPSRARRLTDVVLATSALVALAPVMAVVAALVAGTSRGGAIFRQTRVGQDEQLFEMYKFRTMYLECDDRTHREYVQGQLRGTAVPVDGVYKMTGDPRVTPLGRLLRRSSLDELPQLVNVLRGEMALVGPRPVLPWEARLIGPQHRSRFLVPPGMTGLWQVSGRSRLSMSQALDLDVEYVRRRSPALDAKILLRTIPTVLAFGGCR
jgi:lipopolysaccharide/colanic/teichoic acid biosynthesis glycosyltransferase